MGWPFGEVKLAKHLEELDNTLQSYYGGINMLRMNIKPDEMPDKPLVVILLEQMDAYNTLPFDGALMDQPHLLMREIEIARRVKSVFEASYQNYVRSLQTQRGNS